ncbi:flagellin [Lachnospiraceae bacterium XBB1006]|nr:flagellin [Lachnospiraceae bacterium XBB1006]
MGMVVQHNLSAMNANRQLGITTGNQAKSSEKLSSGYRINRAADDAAGLKISEKMRSQIRGIDKASSNAETGISLIQTAEGALNETHSILQRMNELAVQGANDTNEDIDRKAINEELEALTYEIDRISSTTQFNKKNLLDGTLQDNKLQIGANVGQNIRINIGNMEAACIGLQQNQYSLFYKNVGGQSVFGFESSAKCLEAARNVCYNQHTASVKTSNGKYIVGTGTTAKCFVDLRSVKNYIASINSIVTGKMCAYNVSERVGVDNFKIANDSLSKIQTAINKVSSQRSALGALQNRLEHTIANLNTTSENTSASESKLRDTDMAAEMVNFSKNNILAQAGQSMLAQANQSTQGVLSLLQ